MQITKAIQLIKKYEGYRAIAYRDSVGVLTIGYGHTSGVKSGDKITEQYAEMLLTEDLQPLRSKLASYDPEYHWTENEYNALLSFMYNLGVNSLDQVTKNGQRTKEQISDSMLLYNKAGGRVLPGLVTRRKEEHDLFNLKKNVGTISGQTTINELVDLIYAGAFGNGSERKDKLYNLIQYYVNERSKEK